MDEQQPPVSNWFEELYQQAQGDSNAVPWAVLQPRPAFFQWAQRTNLQGAGRRALVIGCGLGDDAEELARRGFQVTAFDLSPTAVAWCQARFPQSAVTYVVADLLAAPAAWQGAFDFVLEIFTIQALPIDMRQTTMAAIANFVAPAGELFLFALGSDTPDQRTGPPWALTRAELAYFHTCGLSTVAWEELHNLDDPPRLRFRALYRR
ncbi:MAG: class I SAM-dependent methyltransferase [Caldilineaceae bacterium]|nr:class I SAM-dependent methyltransferase [Caldilineaceae bacterium]